MSRLVFHSALVLLICQNATFAGDAKTIASGKLALETRAFTPAYWTVDVYEKAWEHWTPKPDKKPADYDKAFAAYYGLHAAPYKNGRYPMGLRKARAARLVIDCMICHGGSILGNSYLGMGNASLDLQAFLEDMSALRARKETCRTR